MIKLKKTNLLHTIKSSTCIYIRYTTFLDPKKPLSCCKTAYQLKILKITPALRIIIFHTKQYPFLIINT
jgi:hypothetical protein